MIETIITPVALEPEPFSQDFQTNEQIYRPFVEEMAIKYGVSAYQMAETINCESRWDPTIQSYHVRNGVRENSWGIVQIHLTAHPNISKKQATDPYWSIEWMAQQFAKGNQRAWTCWKMRFVE